MKYLVLVLTLFLGRMLQAESMRHCMLLPIIETENQKMGFQVFESVESYLKESHWCSYKSNSELINILSTYAKNLESHLLNKDVLKVIADKTKAGTLIKVSLNSLEKSTEVSIEVIGENGEDRYFKEKSSLNTNDIGVVTQTIKNWLEVYEKLIPYQGKVKGVLGDQFTIDIGRQNSIYNGSEIVIERALSKRQHPLLKEITDYTTEKIAEAKVFDVNENQAQAKVQSYEGIKKIKIDDWVKIKNVEARKAVIQIKEGHQQEVEHGQLGTLTFFADLVSATASQSGNTTRTKNGLKYGGSVEAELWLTRNYWLGFDLGKKIGSLKTNNGTFTEDQYSIDDGMFRLKMAYKYLPMGFFYGPSIDAYLGYSKYTYGFNTNVNDGFSEFSFSGILMGFRASLPLIEKIKIALTFDFNISSTYKEKVEVFGSDDSSSHYRLFVAGLYQWEKNTVMQGGLEFISSKANFTGTTKEEQFKDISVKVGSTFTF